MRSVSNRSSVNMNRFLDINESDIRMDNRGVLARDIPRLIREANGIPERRKPRRLRDVLAEYRTSA